LLLTKVLHVPSISKSLISIGQLTADNNIYVEFHANSCVVKDQTSHKVLLLGIKHNGLYLVTSNSPQALLCQQDSIGLWHHRLCHSSEASLHHLVSSKIISCKSNKLGVCASYCLAKSHRLPFNSSFSPATQPLELVHCDVWRLSPIISTNEYKYYVLFTDHFFKIYLDLFLLS
jgi:GAG-pre-integrase domain